MKENKKVGGRIRTYREKLDMSVYDLAQRSGVDEKLVNAIEKGEVLPELGVLTKISRALGQRLGARVSGGVVALFGGLGASDVQPGQIHGCRHPRQSPRQPLRHIGADLPQNQDVQLYHRTVVLHNIQERIR